MPLFTLFGPDALAQRINDCHPKLLILSKEKVPLAEAFPGLKVLLAGPDFWEEVAKESPFYESRTAANDLAIFQKDAGMMDEDGYFWHKGRSDDVIISAGWTISAVEVEDALLKHPDILEAAVIGVPDELRGLIVKAFVVGRRKGNDFEKELKEFIKQRLSAHEYPRQIEFVDELPKTPAGKVDRNTLRTAYSKTLC